VYFRELKNPLVPFEFYTEFINAASKKKRKGENVERATDTEMTEIDNYNDKLIAMKTLVQGLPLSNYSVLEFLIRHLARYVLNFTARRKLTLWTQYRRSV
jgi:FMN-dependent NADH-azoreductase